MKIASRFDGRTLYECDAETMRDTIERAVKAGANLCGVDLSGVDLVGANLSGANLYRANLAGANLYGANLSGVDLYRADLYRVELYGVDLSGVELAGKPILDIVQVAGIGTNRRCTVAIILQSSVDIRCGCFHGTLEEWVKKIEETHAGNPKYLAQYRAAVAFVRSCADAATAAERQGG